MGSCLDVGVNDGTFIEGGVLSESECLEAGRADILFGVHLDSWAISLERLSSDKTCRGKRRRGPV